MSIETNASNTRTHLVVFFILVCLTLVSSVLALTVLEGPTRIALVLVVAGIQVVLVLGLLMHLRTEPRPTNVLIALAFFFVAILIGAVVLSLSDIIEGIVTLSAPAAVSEETDGEEH